MNKIIATFIVLVLSLGIILSSSVYASSVNTNELISQSTKSKLVEMKDKELKSMEDYKQAYGNDVYGLVGYILNKVRLYSIPIGFLLIAICAIYQFVIGARYLEARNKGFNGMIAIITLFVICQVLPLVFAIVIKGWRG